MLHEAIGSASSQLPSPVDLSAKAPANGHASEPSERPIANGTDWPQSQTGAPSGTKSVRTLAHFLGEVVSLLNESPSHRHLFISDLEWFAVPPIRLGRFRTLHSHDRLIGIAFWASVSEEVENELLQGRMPSGLMNGNRETRLWLIDIIAPLLTKDAKRATTFLSLLAKDAFGGKPFKMWRMNPKTGRPEVVEGMSVPKDSAADGGSTQAMNTGQSK